MKERQELWCHDCSRYVQFDIDVGLDGNHVIVCPNCGHEHCRVVENGRVTEVRWDSRNGGMAFTGSTYMTTGMTSSSVSTYATYTANTAATDSGTALRYNAWMNLTSAS